MQYKDLGNNAGYMVYGDNEAVSFEIMENPRDFDSQRPVSSELDWHTAYSRMGDYTIFPYGIDDRLPNDVRDIVKNNNEAPGMLKKKAQMQWGKGPKLYKEENIDGIPTIIWEDDPAIMAWLKTWDYKKYIMQVLIDYTYIEAYFSIIIPNRRSLLGRPFIKRVEHSPVGKSRLASADTGHDIKPTHGVVSSHTFGGKLHGNFEWYDYPLFSPDKAATSQMIDYQSMFTFGQDVYAIPDILGTLGWLRQSNNIPMIFKAMSENGISAKYHITMPMKYWDLKRVELKNRCDEDPDMEYTESMLDNLKKKMYRTVTEVLSGVKNVGKAFFSEVFYDEDLNGLKELGWKITPIAQNIKEFVESQILISERAAYAISTGLNINPILANVDSNNRANSGSAQIHAHNNHVATGVDMDEIVVLSTLNKVIEYNFPDSIHRMGFYHTTQKREEEVTPSQRHNNINA